jgi:hypothetical protein
MNKIHSLQQLEIEKGRLENRSKELELKIKAGWYQLKHDFDPVVMAKETYNAYISKKIEKKIESEKMMDKTLTYGITLLAEKAMMIINKKLGKFFSK